MQTAGYCRAKAAEMLGLAASANPDMKDHWLRMGAEWTALARRAEREDRFSRRHLSKE